MFSVIASVGLFLFLVTRGTRKSFAAIVLSFLLTVTITVMEVDKMLLENRLEKTVSHVAERDLTVRCANPIFSWFTLNNYAGYVPYSDSDIHGTGTTVHLNYETCRTLKRLPNRDKDLMGTANAVHVLTHEALHVSGVKDEAVAECYAMQKSRKVAVLLRVPLQRTEHLNRFYYRTVYERMPSEYRSEHCVPDGNLDLRLGKGPWTGGKEDNRSVHCGSVSVNSEYSPTVIQVGESQVWTENGSCHRVDGPAVVHDNGDTEYWLNGKQYSFEDWVKRK